MLPLMAAGMGASAIGGIAGGVFGSSGAKKQIQAMREAIAYQKEKDAQTRGDLAPYREFGKEQLGDLDEWMDSPESDPMSFMDPGYEFRRNEGMKGITGNAATAGLLQSGDTLRGVEQYGQGLASEEYGNAFGRRMQEGQFRQGLAGMGQNAAVSGGYLANQGAGTVGNLTANMDAGASDQIWGDVVSGIGGMAGNAMARRAGPGSSTPGGSNIFGDTGLNKFAQTPYYN